MNHFIKNIIFMIHLTPIRYSKKKSPVVQHRTGASLFLNVTELAPYTFQSQKFLSIASPTSPLFS